MNKNTLTEALIASRDNDIETWIHNFLRSGDNPNIALSEGLKKEKRYYEGPIKVSLDRFERVCGPEKSMLYQVDETYFNNRVKKMMDAINDGWDMPPLMIEIRDNGFYMNDGNHRYEALMRLGIKTYYVIFWSSSQQIIKATIS